MTQVVLLVRSRQELTAEIVLQLKDKFGDDIEFIDVEPRTPDDLGALCVQHAAVAVLLRENPLPIVAIRAGIPCIPVRHGQALQRLVSVESVTEPL